MRERFPAVFGPQLPRGLHPLGQEGVPVRVLRQRIPGQDVSQAASKSSHRCVQFEKARNLSAVFLRRRAKMPTIPDKSDNSQEHFHS